jgi:hypothetical protein
MTLESMLKWNDMRVVNSLSLTEFVPVSKLIADSKVPGECGVCIGITHIALVDDVIGGIWWQEP